MRRSGTGEACLAPAGVRSSATTRRDCFVKTTPRTYGRAGALLLLAAAALPAGAQAPRPEGPLKHAPRATTPAITAADAMTRVYVLADDSMMGREAGTRGNVLGTDYIAREARRLGLEPAGENGTFFQTIPLVRRDVDPASTLSVDGEALAMGRDYLLVPSVEGIFTFADRLTAANAPVVYGGMLGTTAVITPEQAAGKLVVFAAPSFRFWTGAPLDRYHAAAGVAVATLDGTPRAIIDYFTSAQMSLRKAPRADAPKVPAAVLVTRAAAERLMGRPLAGLAPGAAGRTVSGSARIRESPTEHPARNVVAVLRGTDPRLRGTYVAIGSHNDHDGVAAQALEHDSLRVFNRVLRPTGADQEPEAETPEAAARIRTELAALRGQRPARRDSIYNGADDDASGVAGMLEIAEHLVQNRPKRSVLFVWHTAEEKGLLGSEHFTGHPTVPRDSIVTMLNIDMIGRGAPGDLQGGGPDYLQLVGSRRLSTQLGDLVEEVNRRSGHGFRFDYTYDANGHPQNIYCRSDHYQYARWGIPVTFFTTGGHHDYHMLTDEPQYLDYDKLAKVSAFIADVARDVANRDARLVVDKPKPDPYGSCQQ
jgi:peptidase M28-like protein